MTTEALIVLALKAAIEKNKDAVISAISVAEGGVSSAVHKFIGNLPKPGGLLGIAFPVIETSVEAEFDSLLNQYGPEVLYALLDAEVTAWAKSLGA